MQVLRDVVATVARADDERTLAAPGLAVRVGARMEQRAAEARERGHLEHVRNAAHAGGENDMARVQLARRAVVLPQADRPALRAIVVATAREFGAGPIVELERLDVGLEPTRQQVF